MNPYTEAFPAYRIHAGQGAHRAGLERMTLKPPTAGEVVIEVHHSSVNYKDALAALGRGKILRRSPLVGGIDLAGEVVEAPGTAFQAGDKVLVTGCGLGESHDGGYARYARVPAEWVIPIPEPLEPFEAMAIGTAGFSAALAIQRLEDNHQNPDQGPVLVSGASGGVGSLAISMLDGLGYRAVALTGKLHLRDYLQAIGAHELLDRRTLEMGGRPLERALWGGAIDNLGGEVLAWLTRTVRPWGNIATIGLAAGTELHTTVMPFILRAVSLLGVSSANCPLERRTALWSRLATDLRPRHLDQIVTRVVGLGQLPEVFHDLLAGGARGRTVVRVRDDPEERPPSLNQP